MTKRVPRDTREPVDPHLLGKQLQMDLTTGLLPRYVQQQAKRALDWYAVEDRKGAAR